MNTSHNSQLIYNDESTVSTDPILLQPKLQSALAAALRRAKSWPLPPNWSSFDWTEEIGQVGMIAAVEAVRDFNPARTLPVEVFVYHRVISRILTIYRREWAYALRCNAGRPAGIEEPGEDDTISRLAVAPESSDHLDVREAVSGLPEGPQRLILQMFWDGCTETELARQLGISQRAVSKRKQAGLQRLRQWFRPDFVPSGLARTACCVPSTP